MSNGNVAVEVDLNEHIERIDIVQDDSHATTYALVSSLRLYLRVLGRRDDGEPALLSLCDVANQWTLYIFIMIVYCESLL